MRSALGGNAKRAEAQAWVVTELAIRQDHPVAGADAVGHVFAQEGKVFDGGAVRAAFHGGVQTVLGPGGGGEHYRGSY